MVSRTEKVRIKSLAEDTRVVVVNAASRTGPAAGTHEFSSDDDSEYDTEDIDLDDDIGANHSGGSLSLGRVYQKTLEILGDELT